MLLNKFSYGKDKLTFESSIRILDNQIDCVIRDDQLLKINKSRKNIINVLKSERKVYGVNTGIGVLCNTIISKEDSSKSLLIYERILFLSPKI